MADETSYPLFYDRSGTCIPVNVWSSLLGQAGYRYVARTLVSSAASAHVASGGATTIFEVSTVWLGIGVDLGEGLALFETTVFGFAGNQPRQYATEKEAIAGHENAVNVLCRSVPRPIRFDTYAQE